MAGKLNKQGIMLKIDHFIGITFGKFGFAEFVPMPLMHRFDKPELTFEYIFM